MPSTSGAMRVHTYTPKQTQTVAIFTHTDAQEFWKRSLFASPGLWVGKKYMTDERGEEREGEREGGRVRENDILTLPS